MDNICYLLYACLSVCTCALIISVVLGDGVVSGSGYAGIQGGQETEATVCGSVLCVIFNALFMWCFFM